MNDAMMLTQMKNITTFKAHWCDFATNIAEYYTMCILYTRTHTAVFRAHATMLITGVFRLKCKSAGKLSKYTVCQRAAHTPCARVHLFDVGLSM